MTSRSRSRRRDELLPHLEVLRGALSRLRKGDDEAVGTIRRIAGALRRWGEDEGEDPSLVESAGRVMEAPEPDLTEAGERLETLVETLVEEGTAGAGPEGFILAVEDSPDVKLLLESVLSGPNREVHVVDTGEEGLKVLEERVVNLLILDLVLPDTDGRNLLLRIRDEGATEDLPVLVLSGKVSSETKAECLALGADAFFEKPVDPGALHAAVVSRLRRAMEQEEEARADSLTGVLRRSAFKERWEREGVSDSSFLALVDLDGFRKVRSRFGAGVSDRVLGAVGDTIRQATPRGCVAARWAESEFLLLCPGKGLTEATDVLQELIARIRSLEHSDPRGETFRVTASAGVVPVEADAHLEEVLEAAEVRLAQAVSAGGNTVADATVPEEETVILVAEDDPLSAKILRHRLEREGFVILHYSDGVEAMEGAVTEGIDLAILDVKMPGMDGFELLERLRKVPAYEDIPIIMLTSMGREEDIERAFELGADDYMLKPFSPSELLARVRRLLKR